MTEPHAMTYGLLPGGDGKPVYECCDLIIMQPPQAMYHLWRIHGLTFEAACDVVWTFPEASKFSGKAKEGNDGTQE